MARPTRRLKAPVGADEANHGTERFRVDNNGAVDVTLEAVDPLVRVGGFVQDRGEDPVPVGMVRLKGEPGAFCAFGSDLYSVGGDGILVVPASLKSHLISHGFEEVEY